MMKKWIALFIALVMVAALCSCTLNDLFSEPEDESMTEWTMISTTEINTEWVTETYTEEEISVEAGHDCAVDGHLWKNATCYAPKTCAACGLTEGVKLEHSFKDATCTSPQRCRYCGKTVGAALGHTWGSDGKCTRCGASKTQQAASNGSNSCNHKWIDATCTTPRTCALCGKTQGEPNKHSFANASCEQPRHCRNCGLTEGSALGHNYDASGYCTRCHKDRNGNKDPNYLQDKKNQTATSPSSAPPATETEPTKENKPTKETEVTKETDPPTATDPPKETDPPTTPVVPDPNTEPTYGGGGWAGAQNG